MSFLLSALGRPDCGAPKFPRAIFSLAELPISAAGQVSAAFDHEKNIMNADNFAKQICQTAEAERNAILKAQEEEKRLTEERHNEKEKLKAECNRICHKIFQPAMKAFAEGLEAATVFAPRFWEVNCIPEGDNFLCIFGAHLPKNDSPLKPTGFVVKTTTSMSHPEGRPAQIQVHFKCYQALPKEDWREVKPFTLPDPGDGTGDSFVQEMNNLDSDKLDEWHKNKLIECAKICANWIFQHPSKNA
jgi:hypothetical protein